jgi:hypothetical protein
MSIATRGVDRAPRPSSLADVLELILDKGIVIDAYVRVSLVGIELLTIDARIVIASVDTYLRFAEAVNRLDLQPRGQVTGLPGLVDGITEGGARTKTRGALGGIKDTATELIGNLTGGDSDEDDGRRIPEGRAAPPARRGSRGEG